MSKEHTPHTPHETNVDLGRNVTYKGNIVVAGTSGGEPNYIGHDEEYRKLLHVKHEMDRMVWESNYNNMAHIKTKPEVTAKGGILNTHEYELLTSMSIARDSLARIIASPHIEKNYIRSGCTGRRFHATLEELRQNKRAEFLVSSLSSDEVPIALWLPEDEELQEYFIMVMPETDLERTMREVMNLHPRTHIIMTTRTVATMNPTLDLRLKIVAMFGESNLL